MDTTSVVLQNGWGGSNTYSNISTVTLPGADGEPKVFTYGTGSEGKSIQSDWNQNDSSQLDYIKNRPFYERNNLLSSISLVFEPSSKNSNYTSSENPIPTIDAKDQYYNIIWNGELYKNCLCRTVYYVYTDGSANLPSLACKKVIGSPSLWSVRCPEGGQYVNVTHDTQYEQQEGQPENLPFVFSLSTERDTDENILQYLDYNNITTSNTTSNNTITIEFSDPIIKLDPKYLPANIQADWNETDQTSLSFVRNKPSLQSDWKQNDSTANDYIHNKPTIPDPQIQADWKQEDETALDYIKNKPNLSQTLPTIETGDTGKILMVKGNEWAKVYKQQLPETNYSKDAGKILYCNENGFWDKLDSNYITETASLSWNTLTQPTETFSISNLNGKAHTAYRIVNNVSGFSLNSFKKSLWTFYSNNIPLYSNVSIDAMQDIYTASNDTAAVMNFTRLTSDVFFCLVSSYIYDESITISVPSPGFNGNNNPIGTIVLEPRTWSGLYLIIPDDMPWDSTISGTINYEKIIYQTQSQADWFETNSTSVKYIKNRPCYVSGNSQFTLFSNYYKLENNVSVPSSLGAIISPTATLNNNDLILPSGDDMLDIIAKIKRWKLTIGNKQFIGTSNSDGSIGNPIYFNIDEINNKPNEKFYFISFLLFIDKNEIELTDELVLITLEAIEDLTYHPLDQRFLPKIAPDIYDKTLSISGAAADAKVTGDRLTHVEQHIQFDKKYAGWLLYIDNNGNPQPLALGRGLSIDNGVLNVTISGDSDSSTAELDVGILDNIILQ